MDLTNTQSMNCTAYARGIRPCSNSRLRQGKCCCSAQDLPILQRNAASVGRLKTCWSGAKSRRMTLYASLDYGAATRSMARDLAMTVAALVRRAVGDLEAIE